MELSPQLQFLWAHQSPVPKGSGLWWAHKDQVLSDGSYSNTDYSVNSLIITFVLLQNGFQSSFEAIVFEGI